MSSKNFDNLVKAGSLKIEPFDEAEFSGLLHSAEARLNDALNVSLSPESRFDLAYNASHALALAALRKQGYRSNHRYIVFQLLPHTLGLGNEVWRIFSKCHEMRNLAEYEGHLELNDKILQALLAACKTLLSALAPV